MTVENQPLKRLPSGRKANFPANLIKPVDLKPGMKYARLNSDLEVEFIEIGKVIPIKRDNRTVAYTVYSARWLSDEQSAISSTRTLRYLAPFIVRTSDRLEVEV